MTASVVAALRLFGLRKLGTPLLTASTPVSAVHPEANARSATATRASPPSACPAAGSTTNPADSATGVSPATTRASPTAIMRKATTTNPYVGTANARPDSRTPRRFATVSNATSPSDIGRADPASAGTAEVRLETPAATDTATVST